MPSDDFIPTFEAKGAETVRKELGLNILTGRSRVPAIEWLREKDAELAAIDRAGREAINADERRTARSAKNAAWAAAIAATIAAIAAIVAAIIAYRAPTS